MRRMEDESSGAWPYKESMWAVVRVQPDIRQVCARDGAPVTQPDRETLETSG